MTSLFPNLYMTYVTKVKRVTFLLGLPCFNAASPKCKQHRKSARWKNILCYPRDYKCTAIFTSSWVEKLTFSLCLLRVWARENARRELLTVSIFQISSLGCFHLSCCPAIFVKQNYVLRQITWRKSLNNSWNSRPCE